LLNDGRQILAGVAEQLPGWIVEGLERFFGSWNAPDGGAGTRRGANARNHDVVEPPGFDRGHRKLVAKYGDPDVLQQEASTEPGDAAGLARSGFDGGRRLRSLGFRRGFLDRRLGRDCGRGGLSRLTLRKNRCGEARRQQEDNGASNHGELGKLDWLS